MKNASYISENQSNKKIKLEDLNGEERHITSSPEEPHELSREHEEDPEGTSSLSEKLVDDLSKLDEQFLDAVKNNDLRTVQETLLLGADVNAKYPDDPWSEGTALFTSLSYDYKDITNELLKHSNINIDPRTVVNDAPWHSTVSYGDLSTLRKIFAIRVPRVDKEVLLNAASNFDLEMFKFLLEYAEDKDAIKKIGGKILKVAGYSMKYPIQENWDFIKWVVHKLIGEAGIVAALDNCIDASPLYRINDESLEKIFFKTVLAVFNTIVGPHKKFILDMFSKKNFFHGYSTFFMDDLVEILGINPNELDPEYQDLLINKNH